MKILIIYATRRGWTQKSAEVLKETLENDYQHDLKVLSLLEAKRNVEIIPNFHLVIVGSSIMSGFWKKGIKRFIKRHKDKFQQLALYVCAGGTINKAIEGKITKEQAVFQAIEKYIYPVKERFALKTVADGAFGGVYEQNKKILFNSWDKKDVEAWAHNIHDLYPVC